MEHESHIYRRLINPSAEPERGVSRRLARVTQ